VVVDVHLRDLEATFVLVCERVDGGRDLLTRSAPDGPEIDEGWNVGLEDFGLEVRIGELFDVGAGHCYLHHPPDGVVRLV
jgi:hypothetical protein